MTDASSLHFGVPFHPFTAPSWRVMTISGAEAIALLKTRVTPLRDHHFKSYACSTASGCGDSALVLVDQHAAHERFCSRNCAD